MAIPIAAILGGAMGGMGMANMFPPLSRAIAHGTNRTWRNEIMSPVDAMELLYRGVITPDQLDTEFAMTGLNKLRIGWYSELRKQLFDAVEAIILWRREEISHDDLLKRLSMAGIPESDIDLWIKFTETRPSVQDIITFAVREVYTPEISEKYGQFEGADDVASTAEKDLKAAGILPDTLKKYWAAHWQLPSIQMGYEMLHRGIITLEELQTLLRTQDVMPFWRDKLIQISYNPLTRVDVRRMHKLGVISEADLVQSYKDIGYNDVNAQRLADFTVLYNAEPETSEETASDREKGEWKQLTKTDIINGYNDGLFTIEESASALYQLGYSQSETDYLLARADYQNEKDMINKLISAYHTAYIGNSLTFNDISDKLQELNLSGQRIATLFNIWDIEKSVKVNKPTKAEVLTFLRKGIIDIATATQELLGMGYAQKYVDWYLATA